MPERRQLEVLLNLNLAINTPPYLTYRSYRMSTVYDSDNHSILLYSAPRCRTVDIVNNDYGYCIK